MLTYSPVTRGTTKNEFLKTIVLFLNCSENTGHVEKSLQAYHLTSIIKLKPNFLADSPFTFLSRSILKRHMQ